MEEKIGIWYNEGVKLRFMRKNMRRKRDKMEYKQKKFETIEEYILQFPPNVQELLNQLRQTIRETAPDAKEKISYQMPCYYLNGNLVYFAAYKKHIGFYPMPSALEAFQKELSEYKSSKGAVQFPLTSPLPLSLIQDMVRFRISENLQNNKAIN